MKRFVAFACAFVAAIAFLGAQEAPTPATFYADAGQQTKEALDASRLLQSKGQWSKAWNLLVAFDPDNKDGYVLAEKIHLALAGNVANGMLISFGFVDLAEGQSIEELRANPPEKQTMADFNPLDLADELEKSGEALPPILSYELGNYLYTVNQEYGENWIQDSMTIQQKAIENYDRALAYDTYSEESLSQHVTLLLNFQKYDAAETVLKKAIAVYPENRTFSLYLASVFNDQGKFDEVYPIVDEVLAEPETTDLTYNAYVEGIKASLNSGDTEKTNTYVEAMIARFPDEYAPMLIQHLIEVQLGTPEKANAVADAVTEKFFVDPNVVGSLLSTWLNAMDPQAGFDYLERSITKYMADDLAEGTLYFYRGLMYAETAQSIDDFKLAIADMEEAERRFGTVYEADNQVFLVIGQLKAEWSQLIEQVTSENSAAPDDQSQQPEAAPDESQTTSPSQDQPGAEEQSPGESPASDATSGATE